MTQIETEQYRIWYDAGSATVFFQGSLRLKGPDQYQLIENLFNSLLEQAIPAIAIDMQQLEFLNSFGISVISKFVLKARTAGNIQLSIKGSSKISWHARTLKNLQRLMKELEVEIS